MTKAEWNKLYHNYRLYQRMIKLYFDAERGHKKRPMKYRDIKALWDSFAGRGILISFHDAHHWLRSYGGHGGTYIWKTLPTQTYEGDTFVYYPHVPARSHEFIRISGRTFLERNKTYLKNKEVA